MAAITSIDSGSDFVKINISNSKTDAIAFELKFLKSLTVLDFKRKLEIITGGNSQTMRLELYSGDKKVCSIDNDTALLGSLPIDTGMRVHVIDDFIACDEQGEKFDLTEEQYESKRDTVRHFLKQNRLGKYNDQEAQAKEALLLQQAEREQRKFDSCVIGSRCQVTVPQNPTRRGTIMYKGELDGKKGLFVGVKYDEPLGKNDGSFNGKRYFECPPNYGGFVSPLSVEVGDFPPEDDLDDEI